MRGIRGQLCVCHMLELQTFLQRYGYYPTTCKGEREYARFFHRGYDPIIIFFRGTDDTTDPQCSLTVMGHDLPMLKAFFKWRKTKGD